MSEPRSFGRLDAGELEALLELRALPGIGDVTLRRLLEVYGTARRALQAPAAELGARAAAERGSQRIRDRVQRTLTALKAADLHVLTWCDAGYPTRLRELHDPPMLLFLRGRSQLLERPAVAVIGSRRPTPYGIRTAAALARELSRAGMVVVSGMARGIDAAAHAAALEGGTIGVLGCGIDVTYPREEAGLYDRVAEEGLLVSEFLPGEPPQPHHFPRRNRIIAALARGVLVVEAAERSGALITVEHALDLGREVFAVPGPIDRPTSVGANRLIQDGAKLVLGAADVLAELGLPVPEGAVGAGEARADHPELSGPDALVWRALDDEPRHVDAVAAASGVGSADALVALLELELRGYVRQLPGKRFVRV